MVSISTVLNYIIFNNLILLIFFFVKVGLALADLVQLDPVIHRSPSRVGAHLNDLGWLFFEVVVLAIEGFEVGVEVWGEVGVFSQLGQLTIAGKDRIPPVLLVWVTDLPDVAFRFFFKPWFCVYPFDVEALHSPFHFVLLSFSMLGGPLTLWFELKPWEMVINL